MKKSLTPTAASILGFLLRGPMTGWDLVEAIDRSVGKFWNTTRSQVYSELKSLAAADLVKARAEGQRGRQPFVINAAGRAAFKKWIARAPGRELIRFPLALSVFFCDSLSSEQLSSFVAAHRKLHAEQLAEYRRQCKDAKRGDLLTLRLGIRYEEAIIAWLDELPWNRT